MDTLVKLSEEEITDALAHRSEWSQAGDVIQRTFQFKNFVDAMKFVNQVADLAEEREHHPDILVRYNKVTLSLSTHDAGGITMKDFGFAEAADEL